MPPKRRIIRTNRIQLIFALNSIIDELPEFATIDEWCNVAENAFLNIGFKSYCHKSGNNIFDYAVDKNELDKFIAVDYHCDMQHDISMLNHDTVDPSGANTDPLFPHDSYWVFRNRNGSRNKSMDLSQLEKCYEKYSHIDLDTRYLISPDNHTCLSNGEYIVDEFLYVNEIYHEKEGDISKENGKRLTEYPYDEDLNSSRRSKEADWLIYLDGRPIYVEYFEGKYDLKKYMRNVEIKREICAKHGFQLIEIWKDDLAEETLNSKFREFL
ncbi:MAG: hypothetical protein R3F48_00040 [Candidatus Zixiibacteriota bacterium]